MPSLICTAYRPELGSAGRITSWYALQEQEVGVSRALASLRPREACPPPTLSAWLARMKSRIVAKARLACTAPRSWPADGQRQAATTRDRATRGPPQPPHQ